MKPNRLFSIVIAAFVFGQEGFSIAQTPAAFGHWPQWRGPDRSNRSGETGLLKEWPTNGPPLLWRVSGLGDGIASVSVMDGRVYTIGYRDSGEFVFAIDTETGEPVWASRIGPAFAENPLMRWLSQRTPTVDADRLYTITRTGELNCLRVTDGKRLWQRSYSNDFGATMPVWGFCDHPLVDGDKLVCTPGGAEASIVALNKQTGEVLWKSAVPSGGKASYAAMMAVETGGIRQYVTFLEKTLVGIDAKDGRLLWRYDRIAGRTANSYTPIESGEFLFCANGYQGAVALIKLVPEGDGVLPQEQYNVPMRLDPFQDSTVRIGDYVYAWQISPFCIDIKTGQKVWGPERGRSKGRSAVTYADGGLYFRTSDGWMILVEATPEGYRERGFFSIPDHVNASGATAPVVAGGRLYLRDNDQLLCYDIQQGALEKPNRTSGHAGISSAILEQPIELLGSRPARIGTNRAPDAIYVPTPDDVVAKMLELAEVNKDDVVYDLGSGDGRIVIAAAKKYGSKAVGYEIDRRLVEQSRMNAAKSQVESLVCIEHKDIFMVDVSGANVIAVYLPSPLLERLKPQFEKLKPGSRIVSHQFEIPGFTPDKVMTLQSKEDGDQHRLFLWRTPLKKSQ